ncbi:MAG TPA: YihY family inner membrane protein [Magnetospirillum sp.]|nr:YihY family inner membrane protein [Magnetospirillum sp.]
MERNTSYIRDGKAHAAILEARVRTRKLASFARYAAARYRKDNASRMAAALSYTSLLSLVPLLAIALAMLAAFPVFDSVRKDLLGMAFQNLVPAIGSVVQEQLNRFIANAGRLTAAGVVGLAFTAVMLLVTIEGSFNLIFRVARERTILSKILVYWTGVTLGPLMIGAAFSLQGYMTAVNKWQVTQAVSPILSLPVPFLLTVLAFTGLFAAIPNRRVRLKDALVGAAVAAVLFAFLRWGFGYYVTSSKAYTSLYGAVAAAPIFLFWMFLSWAVVLVGAEVTAALPEWRAGHHEATLRAQGARRLTLALEVLALLLKALMDNSKGMSRRDLLEATAVAERDLTAVLHRLCAAGFAAPLAGSRYLLARDLDSTTLDDLIVTLELEVALDDGVAAGSPWRARIEPLIEAARGTHKASLAVPLKPLLTATPE